MFRRTWPGTIISFRRFCVAFGRTALEKNILFLSGYGDIMFVLLHQFAVCIQLLTLDMFQINLLIFLQGPRHKVDLLRRIRRIHVARTAMGPQFCKAIRIGNHLCYFRPGPPKSQLPS